MSKLVNRSCLYRKMLQTSLSLFFFLLTISQAQAFKFKHQHGFLEVAGRVQPAYNYDFIGKKEQNRFYLRSARFKLAGKLFKKFQYKLAIELMNHSKEIVTKEAWFSYQFNDWIGLKAGQFKLPFSKIYLESSARWLFIEFPQLSSHIILKRDIGILTTLSTPNKRYRLSLGLFTGRGINVNLDDLKGFPLISARLNLQPLGVLKKGLGDIERTQHFVIGLGLNAAYEKVDAFNNIARETVFHYAADLTIKYQGLFFLAELTGLLGENYLHLSNDKTLHFTYLTIETAYYIHPLRLEPALQFNLSLNADIDSSFNFTAGLNLYPFAKRYFKFMLNFTHYVAKGITKDTSKDALTLMAHFAFK